MQRHTCFNVSVLFHDYYSQARQPAQPSPAQPQFLLGCMCGMSSPVLAQSCVTAALRQNAVQILARFEETLSAKDSEAAGGGSGGEEASEDGEMDDGDGEERRARVHHLIIPVMVRSPQTTKKETRS